MPKPTVPQSRPRAWLTLAARGIGLLALVAAVASGVHSSGVHAQAQAEADRLSVWDGAYLEEQATRGKGEYEYNCASCHINDLAGDPIADVPPLAGDDFLSVWDGKTLKELMDFIRTNMPEDNKGSLNAQVYTDIGAYLLQANKFPAGKNVVGDEQLSARVFIDKERKE